MGFHLWILLFMKSVKNSTHGPPTSAGRVSSKTPAAMKTPKILATTKTLARSGYRRHSQLKFQTDLSRFRLKRTDFGFLCYLYHLMFDENLDYWCYLWVLLYHCHLCYYNHEKNLENWLDILILTPLLCRIVRRFE